MCFIVLTQHSGDQTEDHREDDKDPVPGVRTSHCGNPEENEDECVAHTAPHLQEVFDGSVRLVGDVGLNIWPHNHATSNQTVWQGKEGKKQST